MNIYALKKNFKRNYYKMQSWSSFVRSTLKELHSGSDVPDYFGNLIPLVSRSPNNNFPPKSVNPYEYKEDDELISIDVIQNQQKRSQNTKNDFIDDLVNPYFDASQKQKAQQQIPQVPIRQEPQPQRQKQQQMQNDQNISDSFEDSPKRNLNQQQSSADNQSTPAGTKQSKEKAFMPETPEMVDYPSSASDVPWQDVPKPAPQPFPSESLINAIDQIGVYDEKQQEMQSQDQQSIKQKKQQQQFNDQKQKNQQPQQEQELYDDYSFDHQQKQKQQKQQESFNEYSFDQLQQRPQPKQNKKKLQQQQEEEEESFNKYNFDQQQQQLQQPQKNVAKQQINQHQQQQEDSFNEYSFDQQQQQQKQQQQQQFQNKQRNQHEDSFNEYSFDQHQQPPQHQEEDASFNEYSFDHQQQKQKNQNQQQPNESFNDYSFDKQMQRSQPQQKNNPQQKLQQQQQHSFNDYSHGQDEENEMEQEQADDDDNNNSIDDEIIIDEKIIVNDEEDEDETSGIPPVSFAEKFRIFSGGIIDRYWSHIDTEVPRIVPQSKILTSFKASKFIKYKNAMDSFAKKVEGKKHHLRFKTVGSS